ncbi:dihydroorotase [Desulfosediminicola sp.]|uniref:dihydroorotase n=1 Tax=Desulfosediminicola sp. TaxID=2886825 RepID=UPI003AF1E8B7
MKVDKLFINATIVTHTGRFIGCIGSVNGRIACIETSTEGIEATETVDLAGLHILPGVIDGHIHFQDPGFTERDDMAHGTAACAAGGITTAISHPVNDPAVLDIDSFEINRAAYSGKSIVDYAIHGGGTRDNVNSIADLWNKTGAVSIKMFMCFSVKEFPFVHDDSMRDILTHVAQNDGLAMIHCEDGEMISKEEERLRREGRTDPLAYNESRPEEVEIAAIKKTIQLLKQTGAKALIVHVSTAEGLELIRAANNDGVDIWAETCPHFLTFVREDMNEHGPFLKFSPVMRDEKNRLKMWELLDAGYVHTIGSDHCPFTREEKEAGLDNIFEAPNGIPGLEVMLPVLLDGVSQGFTSLEKIVEITSFNPSKLYGFHPQKGALQVGSDCDLTVVDLSWTKAFTEADRKSKCDWSPYFGRQLSGWPVMTVIRGTVVAHKGEILVEPGYGTYLPRSK